MAIGHADGSIVLSTAIDPSGLKNGMNSLKSAVTKLGRVIGVTFGVGVLVKFSREASKLATDTEANIQRLIDIYGSASKVVGDFIDTNARALGMSKKAATEFSAVYGNLFSVWADQATNAELTNRYLQITAVIASKTGRTVEDVQERIRSGLLGNTEAIEDLGVFVNVKTIEMTDAFKRMANGKSWEQLDAYSQQQIRTMAILEQSIQKYGTEVAKTSALTKSRFNAAFQDFQATWGQVVNRILIPVLEIFTSILTTSTAVMRSIFNISNNTISQSDAIAKSVENQKELTDEIKNTEKAVKKSLASFDDLQILTSESFLSSAGTAESQSSIPSITTPSEFEEPDISWIDYFLSKLDNAKISLQNLWLQLQPFQSFSGQALQDFYTLVLIPIGNWTFGEGFPRFVDSISNTLASVNWETLNGSLQNLWDKVSPFAENVGEGLLWFWENVIMPMSEWALNNFIPANIDLISSAIESINEIIDAAKPSLLWFWETFLVPIRDFVWKIVIDFVNLLTDGFKKFTDWAKENHKTIEDISIVILGFLSGLWVYNTSKNIIGFIAALIQKFIEFGGISGVMTALGAAINSPALAIGALVAAGLYWVKNWNEINRAFKAMTGWEKATIVVLGLAAAIAVLWVAISAGVAAATIVAGLAALGLGAGILALGSLGETPQSSGGGTGGGTRSIPSGNSAIASSVPSMNFGNYSIPGYARGTVVPPNRPHYALFGDNMTEPEVVSPVSTMKNAFKEAMIEMGGNIGGNTEVVLEIDGREFGRAVVEQGNRENRRIGTRLVMA